MRLAPFVLLLVFAPGAAALSPAAREFMKITKELEPVQCEKRKLRREIALAEVEGRSDELKALRSRFEALNREAKTERLERRLAQLEPRLRRSSDPEDLAQISLQQRLAFYRCE